MAEGFARHRGAGVMDAYSAGFMPVMMVQPQTRQVMIEKDVAIDEAFPKGLEAFFGKKFDLTLNMSGIELPRGDWGEVREWAVPDPFGRKDGVFRQVRDRIEEMVAGLIEEIRGEGPA